MKIFALILVVASSIIVAGCGEKADGEVPKGAPPVIKDKDAANGQQAKAPQTGA